MGKGDVHTGFSWKNQEGKKPSGRPKSRWVDNIKMAFQIVGWGSKDRWRAFVNAAKTFCSHKMRGIS
jgi:hypothetical protein